MSKYTFQLGQNSTIKDIGANVLANFQKEPNHNIVQLLHQTAELQSRVYTSQSDFISYLNLMADGFCNKGKIMSDQILTIWITRNNDFFMTFCFAIIKNKTNSGMVFSLEKYWPWQEMELKKNVDNYYYTNF